MIPVWFRKPIDDTYGEYGTSPNIPAKPVTNPVIVNELRYCLFVASFPYILSVPLSAPNVLAVFNKPVKTTVKIIPISHAGAPNGNNSKLNAFAWAPATDSVLKIIAYAIQPIIIPINKPYFRISNEPLILIIITISAITIDSMK